MPKKGEDLAERLRILEQAVALLGDANKRTCAGLEEGQRDIVREIRALKLYLGRSDPEFKQQFPEIHRKVT